MNNSAFEAHKAAVATRKLSIGAAYLILSLTILAVLLLRFSGFFALKGDLISHFLLVDEIMKHGHVRAESAYNIDLMARYPSGSHWLAAIVGWVQGSGLYGISFVSIVSVFVSYLLIFRLIGADSPLNVLAFVAIFIVLGKTHSQIGWEISGNYFYPQLVADVLYFSVLVWLARVSGVWKPTILTIVLGTLAMSVQPLNALHILAAGIALILYNGLCWTLENRKLPRAHLAAVLAIAVSTVLLALFHPSFAAMRQNAQHNGELSFGYSRLFLVALMCMAVSGANLVRHFIRRTAPVDAVLGCAGIAAAGLMLMQYIALEMAHAGSDYAIKKHMFIILTLAAISAARMIGALADTKWQRWSLGWVVSPVLAGMISALVVHKFDTPVRPVEEVLSYARNMTRDISGFRPGDVVDLDVTQPQLVDLTVTLAGFDHPFFWIGGADPSRGAKYAMVHRTAGIDANCDERHGETASYVVVPVRCLRLYSTGQTLLFDSGHDGFLYLGDGWSIPEGDGTWSQDAGGSTVNLVLTKDSAQPRKLSVTWGAFVTPAHPKQSFDVEINGAKVATWDFGLGSSVVTRSVIVPPLTGNTLQIVFKPLNPIAPSTLNSAEVDTRVLGMHLNKLALQ
jgi:hypothetical protein